MEFFAVDNTKYTPKCPNCSETIKFKINPNNFTISVKCSKGHNKQNISLKSFNEKYINSSQIYKINCSNCFNFLEDNNKNYKCEICNKLYCPSCINTHNKKMKHNSKSLFIYKYQLCKSHNQKITSFCETCKSNICSQCKNSHNNHNIKSFIDIIPTKKAKDSVKNKAIEFEKNIQNIIDKINTMKNEVIKRYNKINEYLKFLLSINEKLLIKFNISCYDYYNFENYNYLVKNLDDEKNILNESKYIDYLLKKEESKEKTKSQTALKLGTNNNYIESYNNLEYLKENIFYAFESRILKLFEFKDFSFNIKLIYDPKAYHISGIQPAKYKNIFFLKYYNGSCIKFLEYDLSKNTCSISNKVINNGSLFHPKFEKCFDLKDGSILTYQYKKINIWKEESKNKNKNSTINEYNLKNIHTIDNAFDSIFIITPDLFCFQDNNRAIKFYNTSYYTCNKTIHYSNRINFLGIIKNESIIFNEFYDYNTVIIVNMKYLEIVSKIIMKFKNNNIIIRDNYFMNFYIENYRLKIIKMKYDKNLDEKEIITKNNSLQSINHILMTDIGYLVLCNCNNISFINLN